MVGGIVMAGMMGGLALLLANLSKQQHFVQKTTETHFEVKALFDTMAKTLYDGEACKKTLGVGVAVTDGRSINSINNRDGGVVFNTTDKYGNRLLQIESMTLKNTQITGNSGSVDIEVVLLKLSSVLKGYKKAVQEFPISFDVASGTSNLTRCHHSIDNLDQVVNDAIVNEVTPIIDTKLDTVVQELCTVFGGSYSNSRCLLPSGSP